MYLSTRVLGTSIVADLSTRAAQPVLTIGRDRFRRSDLATIGCFNFIAAQRLSVACAALKVTSTRHLFDTVAPGQLVLPGVGAVSLAVLGAAFEARGIGGGAPLETWMQKHRADATHDVVTFATLKAQGCCPRRGRSRRTRRPPTYPPDSGATVTYVSPHSFAPIGDVCR